ncbi:LOW QUALITY PROTEIN: hypothetical protein PanWU01x14_239480 [Parasponia andersonii]|uniref:Uncharacterized protein n=1 Tax=Parasponia andersonii TaxID=3476 RepID=A0A2P5BH92_PARAD|nr:LOW QUALITY PROTEIN: hypothetical protein PanWU01x14_239480 [Parasponia andersonii]
MPNQKKKKKTEAYYIGCQAAICVIHRKDSEH